MEEIIKINYDAEQPTVSARELHEGLEIKSNFTTWFDRMCENGLTENDYTVMWSDSKNGNAVEFEKMRITYWLLKKKKPIIQRIR